LQTSLNWLLELAPFSGSHQDLARELTARGSAVQSIEPLWTGSPELLAVRVADCKRLPNSNSLSVCRIQTGSGEPTVVCGAPNVRTGMMAVWIPPGAALPNGLKVESRKMHGVESAGMLCSEAELGLSDEASGILELPADTPPGRPAAELFGDFSITFELTPNRPDCLSCFGIARELAALSGPPFRVPPFERGEEGAAFGDAAKVRIDDPEGCPRYAVALIEGLSVGPSPWWLKQRVLACGMRPINNLVDVSNFVMLETGQPLHAFDYDALKRKEIVVKSSKAGESFQTLDLKTHVLPEGVVLITDGVSTIGLGGIMGGKNSEVTASTTTVLLEAAYFNPRRIRRARKALGIASEAALRFEKGCDPNMVPYALERAAHLLAALAGGQVRRGGLDVYPTPLVPRTLTLRVRRANALLGLELPADRMAHYLSSIRLDVTSGEDLTVRVPTFRPDLEREIDLVEEVARLHGQANIPARERGGGRLFDAPDHDPAVEQIVHRQLPASGFNEAVTGSLGTRAAYQVFRPDLEPVAIANPISEDLSHLRTGLLADLAMVADRNFNHRNLDWRMYTVGTVFLPAGAGKPPTEEQHLGLALAGLRSPRHYSGSPVPTDWSDLMGVVEDLCAALRVTGVRFVPAQLPGFARGEGFQCLVGNVSAGVAGRLDPAAQGPWDIKEHLWLAELKLSVLREERSGDPQYQPLPRFPAVMRDLALVVKESVPAADLLATIRQAAGSLLVSLEVFDVYRGKPLAAGTKSLAFNLVFQSSERSLEAAEIDSAMAAVLSSVDSAHSAVLRQ
jgi:phenylalanyl-tRNA synthetase beta chain